MTSQSTDHPIDGRWSLRHPLRVARLSNKVPTTFDLVPDDATRAALARELGISAVVHLRFLGALTPRGRRDFDLEARFEARVVQPCVVSLRPVTTDLADQVRRRFVQDYVEPDADETEMPQDDSIEPLAEVIDIGAVAVEALALLLPQYPRAPGARFAAEDTRDANPATEGDRPKPFASLAGLAAKMAGKPDGTDENGPA